MPSRTRHDWADLSPGMKNYYKGEGIQAGTYNKWWSMPQTDRTQLTVEAKAHGYESGLKFLATQAQVRRTTGRTITVSTTPREAARRMIRGTKGTEGKRQRRLVAQLFDFSEFDQLEWSEFMSP